MDIRLEDVVLRRDAFTLKGTLTISAGIATAVIGPSGGGKSTLLDLIAGFEVPDQGRILIGGQDVTELPPAHRPVAQVFQDNNLFPHLSVLQNVGLARAPNSSLGAQDRAAVMQVLSEVGLAGFEARKPATLSGGQQSRAALARALLQDRPVLLLDEPFAALGPALRAEMLALVARLQKQAGLTVVMVTHDPADARKLAAETIVVVDGSIREPRPTEALFAHPDPALAAYLGASDS